MKGKKGKEKVWKGEERGIRQREGEYREEGEKGDNVKHGENKNRYEYIKKIIRQRSSWKEKIKKS